MRILLCLVLATGLGWADQWDLTDAQAQDIIKKFAAKEAEFARARENYTYRQTSRVQEIELGGAPGGKWEVVADIVFNADGKRTERVVRAPVPNLQHILLTPEDEQDLRSVQPFVLTSKDIDKYFVRYLGHETLDEIGCYTFAVKPKKVEAGQRYFSGIVWVDDRDLQIVKSYGRGVGVAKKNAAYPKFETFREQIDGKYWFPTYTSADSTLYFDDNNQRIKLLVKYEDYKQFKADANIIYGDPVDKPAEPAKPPVAEPKKP